VTQVTVTVIVTVTQVTVTVIVTVTQVTVTVTVTQVTVTVTVNQVTVTVTVTQVTVTVTVTALCLPVVGERYWSIFVLKHLQWNVAAKMLLMHLHVCMYTYVCKNGTCMFIRITCMCECM
jgi:hypothetical protein